MNTPQQMGNLEQSPPQKKQFLILDTNIIISAGSSEGKIKHLKPQILNYITELIGTSPEWDIAISEITRFELYVRRDIDEEAKHQNILEGMRTFELGADVMRAAGRLTCFYKEEGIGDKEIEIPDLFIAATSVVTNLPILTTNLRDYPAPFFKEYSILRRSFEYPGKRAPSYLHLYVVTPEIEVIQKYHNNRLGSLEEQQERIVRANQSVGGSMTSQIQRSEDFRPTTLEQPK